MEAKIVSGLAEWRQSTKKVKCNVVLTGQSGSGKSTFLNALFDDEVREQPGKSKDKLKKGEKHVLNYKGNSLTFWDTCGFFEQGDPRTDQAFDALKTIPCLKKKERGTLIYAISITKACFENDIHGIRKLHSIFGPEIWKNSIIVLTELNEDYKPKTVGISEDKMKEESLAKNYKDWVDKLRAFFSKEIMPKDQAEKIVIIPAGYFSSIEANSEALESECEGQSWVLNVWQHIALVAPIEQKPFLLDVCIKKLFSAKYFFSDIYLSLIKLSGKFYQQKASEVSENHCKVGVAYSFLHSLLFWFDNYCHNIKSKLTMSPSDIAYWTNLELSVKVIVTGAETCGKTSLINSMLHGKRVLDECSSTTEEISINHGDVTLTLVETPLSLLSQWSMDDTALVILCMRFNDTEVNMIRILHSAFKIAPNNNFLIVLTYANANVSGEPLVEAVEHQTSVIKRILKDKVGMNEQIVDSLKVVPASYHTEAVIKGDPSNKHWIMNLWLQAIASARPSSQAALIVLVNYYIYCNVPQPRKLAHYKTAYIQDLIAVLQEIILTQELDLWV